LCVGTTRSVEVAISSDGFMVSVTTGNREDRLIGSSVNRVRRAVGGRSR
jgi:hypothetical protein